MTDSHPAPIDTPWGQVTFDSDDAITLPEGFPDSACDDLVRWLESNWHPIPRTTVSAEKIQVRSISLDKLLVQAGLADSVSQAKRLRTQGAVYLWDDSQAVGADGGQWARRRSAQIDDSRSVIFLRVGKKVVEVTFDEK